MAARLVAAFLALACCSTTTPKEAATPATAMPSVTTSVSATNPGGPVSKAEFLGQAKPVCQSVTSKVDALPDDPVKRLSTLDERAGYLADALRRLRVLAPPPGDEATVNLLLDHLEAVRRDTTDEAAALRAGDRAKAAQLEARFDADEDNAKKANSAYGLGDCGA